MYAWGERVADRVEFEENALKAVNTSFMPDAPKSEFNLGSKDEKALFIYPKGLSFEALDGWKSHVRLREPYHKRYVPPLTKLSALILFSRYFYLWSLGLPITAPIGIAPIIPNIPFYFCAWRAWCHWKGQTYHVRPYTSLTTLSLAQHYLFEPAPHNRLLYTYNRRNTRHDLRVKECIQL